MPVGPFEEYYFRQVHRDTWVCLTCYANVDREYRKLHAVWHANKPERCRFDPGKQIVRSTGKRPTYFRVSIKYDNGVNTVERVQLL